MSGGGRCRRWHGSVSRTASRLPWFRSPDERDGRDRVGFDAGVIYRLGDWLAVDAALETTPAGRGPEYAPRAGVSGFGR
jgi:hypothetical protein